jgi:hypothetical protein
MLPKVACEVAVNSQVILHVLCQIESLSALALSCVDFNWDIEVTELLLLPYTSSAFLYAFQRY